MRKVAICINVSQSVKKRLEDVDNVSLLIETLLLKEWGMEVVKEEKLVKKGWFK